MKVSKNLKPLKIVLLFLAAAVVTSLFSRQSLCDDSTFDYIPQKYAATSLSAGFVKPTRIIIADDSFYAPFAFLDVEGRPAGITIDIWKLWSSKTGIAVEFHLMPLESALSAVENGEADVIGSLFKTEKRQNNFAFADPLYSIATNVFFHKQIQGIRGIEDRQGFPVGIVKGDSSKELILQRYPKALLLEYSGTDTLVSAAVNGDIKVFVADSEVARYYLAKSDQNNVFHEAIGPVDSNWQYAGVRKGNSRILEVVQDGFSQISKKEIQTIVDSWTGKLLFPQIFWPIMQFLTAIIATLLTFVLLWNISLRKTVAKTLRHVEQRNLDLQDSEARFKAFFDLAPSGCAVTDLQGRYKMVNQTTCYRIGMREEEIIGHTRSELGINIDKASYENIYKELLNSGEVIHQEVVVTSVKGLFHLIYSSRLIESGGEQLILSSTVDITERKRMEEALRESESYNKVLFKDSFIPLVVLDPETARFEDCNNAALAIHGFTERSQLLAKTPKDVSTPHQYDGQTSEIAGAVKISQALDQGSLKFEWKHQRPDGTAWDSEVHLMCFTHRNKRLIQLSLQDITGRKRAEEDLKESEERFSKAFRSSPAPMVITDIDTDRFIDANERWLQMTGYSWDETFRRTSFELGVWQDVEIRAELGMQLLRHGSVKDIPCRIRTKSADVLDVLWSAEIINLGGNKVMLSLVCDNTEKKKAQREREKLQAQLQQSQKMESVGRLAGGVAHDYNNMLGVIIGHAELAMLKMDEGHEMQSHLKGIMDAAKRSAELTQQLLAFARRQNIAPKILDLNMSVTTTLQMLRKLIGENIELAWLPGTETYLVKIDPSQFDQLLMNLCVNARDAISGVGRINIETERLIVDEAYCASSAYFIPGDYAVLIVSDNGCGMDRETQTKIFEPFFTTKSVGMGTGLGLATAYGIVKQNNGFINVYSEPGQGTTFKIYLPFYNGLADKNRDVQNMSIPRGSGEIVLVVEDEAVLLHINTTMLEGLGYKVLAASTPAEAILLCEEQAGVIHLLMTDVVMPGMNGRELQQHIHKCNPGIRCLFMSGYTANVISHHGFLDEDVYFIQKPFSLKEMAIKVRETLDYDHNVDTYCIRNTREA